mgnify:CR=1 FL=1
MTDGQERAWTDLAPRYVIDAPRDDAATIAGLFMEELQRVPVAGDLLEFDDVQLTVLEDGQRVRVSLMEPQEDEDED